MTNVYMGLKTPATLPLAIVDKVLMVIGEVDICTIPDTLYPIHQATMVDCLVCLLPLIAVHESLSYNERGDSRGGDVRR